MAIAYANSICNLMALVAIISAIAVITVKNPVNSVLWLIVAFVAVACYLITAGITFMGLSYIIVYVGAIAVLFLFVVMMLNIASISQDASYSGNDHPTVKAAYNPNKTWPLALLIVLISVFTIIPMAAHSTFDMPISVLNFIDQTLYTDPIAALDPSLGAGSVNFEFDGLNPANQINGINQVQMLGLTLYTHGALWLLIISILLMLAMLVPLALAFTP